MHTDYDCGSKTNKINKIILLFLKMEMESISYLVGFIELLKYSISDQSKKPSTDFKLFETQPSKP